ncbi:MAG: hypothetical protein ACTTJZ_00905 [Sphaerochaetaceae bacterium]
MKANLADLNNVLFEQIERINDDELTGALLDEQLKKTKAITSVASTIVANAALALHAAKIQADEFCQASLPDMFSISEKALVK